MVEAKDVSSGRILEASSFASPDIELLMSTASLGCRVVDVEREVYESCARSEGGWKRSV